MSVIPVGHGEAVVTLTIPGDAGPALNIFGFAYDVATPAATVASDIAGVLSSTSGYRGLLPSVVTLSSVLVRCRADAGDPLVAEETISLAGSLAGNTPPPQTALLIQKITGRAGRKNRGRMYIPANDESILNDAGVYGSTETAGFQTKADSFLAALDTAGYPMVLLHTSVADAPTDVVSLVVQSKVATQRRRLR